MRVFATVGTTPFDELVIALDRGRFASEAFIQLSGGDYVPRTARWARFVDDVDARCAQADVVICHAGAGSVFELLDAGIRPIVVPNLARRDVHQAELGRWLQRKRYAPVAWQPEAVDALIAEYARIRDDLSPFDTPRFFYDEQLNDQLRQALRSLRPD